MTSIEIIRKSSLVEEATINIIEKSNVNQKKYSKIFFYNNINSFSNNNIAKAVVIVDPWTTGACVAKEVENRGLIPIAVWSCNNRKQIDNYLSSVPEWFKINYEKIIYHENIEQTINDLINCEYDIIASLAGAEQGVELNDIIASKLNLKGNLLEKSNARRNKYDMGEAVRAAGLRAVKQLMAKSWILAK